MIIPVFLAVWFYMIDYSVFVTLALKIGDIVKESCFLYGYKESMNNRVKLQCAYECVCVCFYGYQCLHA